MFQFTGVRQRWVFVWFIVWTFGLTAFIGVAGQSGWLWQFAGLEKYILRSNSDGWLHNAFTIERVRKASTESEKIRWVMLGGSACMEAITSDQDMKNRIMQHIDKEVAFDRLCSSYMTFSDMAKITSRLGNFNGTLLLMVEPLLFDSSPKKQLTHPDKVNPKSKRAKYFYLSLPVETKNILKKYGSDIGIMHDTISYFKLMPGVFIQVINTSVLNKIYSRDILYVGHPLNEKQPKQKLEKNIKSQYQNYELHKQMNYELLESVIKIAQKNNLNVVFIDFPISRPYRDLINSIYSGYDLFIQDLIRKYNIKSIDIREADDWPDEYYWDVHHMTPQGRKRFTELLSLKLVKQVRDKSINNGDVR